MGEVLDIFDLNEKFLGKSNRKKIYAEIKKEYNERGRISRKVKTVRVLLMNSQGRIYLQKRSNMKAENAGLYDKTVGGHVTTGDSYDLTVIRECAEELGFPAALVPMKDLIKAAKSTNLTIVGLFTEIDKEEKYLSERVMKNGKVFVQPQMTRFYFGYYDGAIRFVDGESSGIEVFSLKELEMAIKDNSTKFTKDIIYMIRKYKKYIKPIA